MQKRIHRLCFKDFYDLYTEYKYKQYFYMEEKRCLIN